MQFWVQLVPVLFCCIIATKKGEMELSGVVSMDTVERNPPVGFVR